MFKHKIRFTKKINLITCNTRPADSEKIPFKKGDVIPCDVRSYVVYENGLYIEKSEITCEMGIFRSVPCDHFKFYEEDLESV